LTHINLTKLDVLDELETIKLGVGYKVDGKTITSVPSEIATLEKIEMVYEDIPGWQSDISKVRKASGQRPIASSFETVRSCLRTMRWCEDIPSWQSDISKVRRILFRS